MLPNHSHYLLWNRYLYIIGEVQNDTANCLAGVQVTVKFFDNSGQLVDISSAYAKLFRLPAGDKTCFAAQVSDPVDWSYYEFDLPSYYINSGELPNLAIFNDSGIYKSSTKEYKIVGQVRNDGDTRISSVKVVGALYNASDTIIDCDAVSAGDLDPGQTASFNMTFNRRDDYADVASYRLQAE